MKITILKIKDLKPNPKQPRQNFDKEKIRELAQSIKESDLLQPPIVRKLDGQYQIVAGERRIKALKLLGKTEVDTIIWEAKDDIEALEKSAIENLQREDLTSVEKENVIYDLWKSGRYKDYTDLAKKLGANLKMITDCIRAKEDRQKFSVHEQISTRSIAHTKTLPDKERKEIFKKLERKELSTDLVDDYVAFKKQSEPEKHFKGKTEVTSETKEKYIYGKLVQSLNSIVMLSVGWNKERVKLIDRYAKTNEKKKIVKSVEELVKKWTEILRAFK